MDGGTGLSKILDHGDQGTLNGKGDALNDLDPNAQDNPYSPPRSRAGRSRRLASKRPLLVIALISLVVLPLLAEVASMVAGFHHVGQITVVFLAAEAITLTAGIVVCCVSRNASR